VTSIRKGIQMNLNPSNRNHSLKYSRRSGIERIPPRPQGAAASGCPVRSPPAGNYRERKPKYSFRRENLLAAGVPWTGIMRRRNRLGAPILRQPRASDARIRAGRRFSCSRRTQGTWAGAENRCSAVEVRHKDAGRTKKMGSCPVSIGVDLPPIFL
jgi:hypothetical protein